MVLFCLSIIIGLTNGHLRTNELHIIGRERERQSSTNLSSDAKSEVIRPDHRELVNSTSNSIGLVYYISEMPETVNATTTIFKDIRSDGIQRMGSKGTVHDAAASAL